MRQFVLSAMALVFSAPLACAQNISVAQTSNVATLPCSIFQGYGSGSGSLKEGVILTIPVSQANNTELFAQLDERIGECRDVENATVANR